MLPCIMCTYIFGQNFQGKKKSFIFIFLIQIFIFLLLGTYFLEYKRILVFIV